jgi:hypothetical protein
MGTKRNTTFGRPFLLSCSLALAAVIPAVSLACSSPSASPSAAPGSADIVTDDAATATPIPEADASSSDAKPTGECASTFGSALTSGFGRIDGIVYAVQKPSDTTCTLPNGTHVVLQVLMNSDVYRMVINVSDRKSEIRVGITPHVLPSPMFAEGWHLDANLDYVETLGVHSTELFTPLSQDEAVAKIVDEVKVGDPVSVYATSEDRPSSAHLVHRNKANRDGAIVVTPTTAPRFLLFHFANQSF